MGATSTGSSVVERLSYTQLVRGSNPFPCIPSKRLIRALLLFLQRSAIAMPRGGLVMQHENSTKGSSTIRVKRKVWGIRF